MSTAAPSRPPLRVFLTILHLAALGAVGSFVFGTLGTMLGLGVALAIVGIGLAILCALVFALFGVGWFEVVRVAGLYDLDIPRLEFRTRERPGFGGWLRMVWRQAFDGRMWRSVVSLLLGAIAGGAIIHMFRAITESATSIFLPVVEGGAVVNPFGLFSGAWSPLAGIGGILFFAAAIVGVALLHRLICLRLIGPDREAELAQAVETTSAQREGAVRAADVERTRIERDLHDGVQPRLVSVGMTLGRAQQKIENDPEAARELINEAHTSTKAAITELRQLARGIHASVLDDRGLDAALSALVNRSHIPVALDVRIEPGVTGAGSTCRDAEAAVYFAVAESLTNAAKHSRASECRVVVRSRPGELWARVEDNGVGGAQVQPGGGLDGVTNRVLAAGGNARLDSPIGGPTALEVTVPCVS